MPLTFFFYCWIDFLSYGVILFGPLFWCCWRWFFLFVFLYRFIIFFNCPVLVSDWHILRSLEQTLLSDEFEFCACIWWILDSCSYNELICMNDVLCTAGSHRRTMRRWGTGCWSRACVCMCVCVIRPSCFHIQLLSG